MILISGRNHSSTEWYGTGTAWATEHRWGLDYVRRKQIPTGPDKGDAQSHLTKAILHFPREGRPVVHSRALLHASSCCLCNYV